MPTPPKKKGVRAGLPGLLQSSGGVDIGPVRFTTVQHVLLIRRIENIYIYFTAKRRKNIYIYFFDQLKKIAELGKENKKYSLNKKKFFLS